MNINFILIQLIGLLAGIILILSYFRKDTNKVLSFHIISNTLDFIHYLLLGAYSGEFIYLLEGTRDFLYYKTDKDKYIFARIVADTEETARTILSNIEFLYLADNTDNGIDIIKDINVAINASFRVAGKRERISSDTGRPV